MKLVTDGEKWAIKRRFYLRHEFFNFFLLSFYLCQSEDSWTDKDTAEKWLRRLKA